MVQLCSGSSEWKRAKVEARARAKQARMAARDVQETDGAGDADELGMEPELANIFLSLSRLSWAGALETNIVFCFLYFGGGAEKVVGRGRGVGVCSLASVTCRKELRVGKEAYPTRKQEIPPRTGFRCRFDWRQANPRS